MPVAGDQNSNYKAPDGASSKRLTDTVKKTTQNKNVARPKICGLFVEVLPWHVPKSEGFTRASETTCAAGVPNLFLPLPQGRYGQRSQGAESNGERCNHLEIHDPSIRLPGCVTSRD